MATLICCIILAVLLAEAACQQLLQTLLHCLLPMSCMHKLQLALALFNANTCGTCGTPFPAHFCTAIQLCPDQCSSPAVLVQRRHAGCCIDSMLPSLHSLTYVQGCFVFKEPSPYVRTCADIVPVWVQGRQLLEGARLHVVHILWQLDLQAAARPGHFF